MNPAIVGISEYKIAQAPQHLITYGLGSCVAIVLYCEKARLGAMAHVMLPLAFDRDEIEKPGKYADTAITAMLKDLEERSIFPRDLTAKMAGGAEMFPGGSRGISRRIGPRNSLAAVKTLKFYGVTLAGQDTGGNMGRTVEFQTETGIFTVRTLKGATLTL